MNIPENRAFLRYVKAERAIASGTYRGEAVFPDNSLYGSRFLRMSHPGARKPLVREHSYRIFMGKVNRLRLYTGNKNMSRQGTYAQFISWVSGDHQAISVLSIPIEEIVASSDDELKISKDCRKMLAWELRGPHEPDYDILAEKLGRHPEIPKPMNR